MECLRLVVALSLVMTVAAHSYSRRFGHGPFLTHNRGMFWRRLPAFMPRYPTSIAGFRHHRMPFLNRYHGTTVYPAKGRGPNYRPMWPAELNTYHPQGTLRPDIVIPAEDVLVNSGVTGQQIQPGLDRAPIFIVPGAGFLRPATPERKPDTVAVDQDTNVSPPEVKPVDLTPDNIDDNNGATEPLPPVITITSMLDETEKNDSCHVKGCGTGHECVFNKEYICPIYIPSVPCECVPGCRMDYKFIPLGGFIKMDECGNTCSCNNIYGAAECTQRMCNPENVVPEGMFPEVTPPPPATVPDLKDPTVFNNAPAGATFDKQSGDEEPLNLPQSSDNIFTSVGDNDLFNVPVVLGGKETSVSS